MRKVNGSSQISPHVPGTYLSSLISSGKKRRAIAWLLTVAFFVTFLPLQPGDQPGLITASAQDPKALVTIQNSYNNVGGSRAEKFIAISQDFRLFGLQDRTLQLDTLPVGVNPNLVILDSGSTSMRASLNPDIQVQSAEISGVKAGEDQLISYFGIAEADAPEIISLASEVVNAGETIIIRGNNLNEIVGNSAYTINVGGTNATITNIGADPSNPDIDRLSLTGNFPNGLRDINIVYDDEKPTFFNTNEDGVYTLRTIYNYRNAVRIIATLDLDGMSMFPTIGEIGSRVRFTRSEMSQNGYDVYFIRDLNDLNQYNATNRAIPVSQSPVEQADGSFVYTVTVPNVNLDQGQSFYVVLTRRGDLDARYVMPSRFRIVRVDNRPTITNFDPAQASSLQPTDVTLDGENFTFLDVPGLEFDAAAMNVPVIPEVGLRTITVEYTPEVDGDSQFDFGDGTIVSVTQLTRSFSVDIGQPLDIIDFSPKEGNGQEINNSITVRTRNITILEETQVPVTMQVLTTITLEDGRELVLEQLINASGQFTYIPSTEAPNVTEVVPYVVPIEEIGGDDYIDTRINELMMVIKGDNFLVSRYREGGQEKINYPKVRMGGVIIDPNREDVPPGTMIPGGADTLPVYVPDRYQVLRNGIAVDGIGANEVGNTIVFYLNTGSSGFQVANSGLRDVAIMNPRRDSSEFATFVSFPEKIVFKEVGQLDFPVITSVAPNLIALEGGMEIRVQGNRFNAGATVYLEGREVPNVEIAGNGQEITFMAPAGQRAGETQLIVINPDEGGLATYPFTYTTTFTQPTLTSVTPPEGTQGTLITLSGSNYLRPDANIRINNLKSIDAFLMNRLIGTRVFLGNNDINTYNVENNRITLREYHEDPDSGLEVILADPVLVYRDNTDTWGLGQGFDSVLFYSEDEEKLYRITRDANQRYYLDDGDREEYQLLYQEGAFYARQSGTDYLIDQPQEGVLQFNGKTLKAWTPYLVERIDGDDTITGNRVQFIDGQTLRARVPNLGAARLFDVAAVNPDTREARIVNGFRYYTNPFTMPTITDIVPELGPDTGGNTIIIEGVDNPDNANRFIDSGGTEGKVRVYIGSQRVPDANVFVFPDNRRLRVVVPPYPGNILDKSNGRLTVPLVLVNPGGGTDYVDASKPLEVGRSRTVKVGDDIVVENYTARIEGYTYIVPESTPVINTLSPNQAPAAGRTIVNISGLDFRNFRDVRDEDGNKEYTIEASNEKATSTLNSQYQVYIDPLYPQVFFGTQRAEIVEYAIDRLQVVIPPGTGTVPVYVVNNDAGISNTLNFQYIASNPVISSINPDRADRRGGTLVEILGQDMEQSLITLLNETFYADDHETMAGLSQREDQPLALVRVGQRTNKNLPDTHSNFGNVVSRRATVTLEGGLTVEYIGEDDGILNVSIQDRGTTYTHQYLGFDSGEEVFIDTSHLTGPAPDAAPYPYQELVRVEVETQAPVSRLILEGGYAPEVIHRSNRQLVSTMPAYFTTGTVPLTVENPDGSTASRDIIYITPDSNPVITNITREGRPPILETRDGYGDDPIRIQQVSHRGGNVISVFGTDFRAGAGITIGNVVTLGPDAITENLDGTNGDRLTFTMPSLPENTVGSLYRVVVTNVDGGSASSDQARDQDGDVVPLYIEIIKGESDPRLDTVTPAEGPVTGGTRIALTGSDFRRTMEGYETNPISVFFGEQRVEDGNAGFEFVDYQRINVTAPASNTVGLVNIRVENPDGELSLPPGQFRYISQPTIATIEPARVFANDTQRDVTVTGTMFQNGAQVILGGRLVPAGSEPASETNHGTGILGVDDNGVNRRFSVVGGVAATSVTATNENVMVLNFPEALDLNTNDLIIINPDGGLSDPFADFDYAIPVPDKPLVLEAIPGAEGSVQLIWSKSAAEVLNAADRYEIYGKKSTESQYVFIGDTRNAQHLVRGLALDTRYDFMVRAMNRYGSAIEFAEASTRTFSAAQDPKLGEKVDELDRQQEELDTQGKEEVVGNRVIRTVGSREIPAGTTPYVISFAGAQYSRQNEFVVAFPAASLGSMTRPVRITDGNASLTITPSHLLTREVSGLTAPQRRDAVVLVNFTRVQGQNATALVSAMSRLQSRASAPYSISFGLQAGRSQQSLARLMGNASLSINLDTGTYRSATATNTGLTVYDPSRHAFTPVTGTTASFRDPGTYQLTSSR